MTRLELIMSNTPPKSSPTKDDVRLDDDANAPVVDPETLLAVSFDRALTVDEQAILDEAMRHDPALQTRARAFHVGRALMKNAPAPDAPSTMLSGVHRRLAEERRMAEEQPAPVPMWRRPATFMGMAMAGAAAAVVLAVVVPSVGGNGAKADGVGIAGVSFGAAQDARVVVEGVSDDVIARHLNTEELVITDGVVVGDARALHRVLMLVRADALKSGGRVIGAVPENGLVSLTIVRAAAH